MNKQAQERSLLPWIVWGLGALVFFTVYFPRVTPSLIQDELMSEFHIDGFGFGTLTAFFLYAYVPMQVPVGMLVDRFGAKRLLYIMSFVAGLGCVIFASAHVLWVAKLGRFLTGFGGAFGFVGALKLAKEWFPSEKLGLLAGLTQALGMIGAFVGEAPVALTIEHIGWRTTMMIMAGMFFCLGLFIILLVQDKSKEATDEAHYGFFEGLLMVVKNSQSWVNGMYLGFAYAPVMAFAEAWGVSFIKVAYGVDTKSAALAIGLIFIGWGFGGPVMGMLSDRIRRRKPLMLLSSFVDTVLILAILYETQMSLPMLYLCTFLFGFFNTGVGVAYAVSGEINKKSVAGTSMAFANMASIIIGMALEPIIGHLLDASGGVLVDGIVRYTVTQYQDTLVMLPIGLALSFLFAIFVKETRCRQV